jgi:hypothetical protein
MRTPAESDQPVSPSVFDTQITLTRGGAEWGRGLDLALGYLQSEEWAMPVPVVTLGGEDVSQQANLSVDEGDVLHVEIDLTAIASLVCAGSRPLYLRATAIVSAAGDSFDGNVGSTCDSRSGSKPFGWTGTVVQPEHAKGVRRMIAVLARSRHIEQP